jgi:cyclophilin family peptidyl-prolyl cis-trans isomerase
MTRAGIVQAGRQCLVAACALLVLTAAAASAAGQSKPIVGPPLVGSTVVVETSKGRFEFETYPVEAPKTVAHIVALVRRGFYDGQRFHRAVPGFLVQWGDPRSRDTRQEADWGRGPEASSGQPVGIAEISKKRLHTAGAVAVAHPGNPAAADSQLYVTLANRPDLDGYYTVLGHVTIGADVPATLQRGDLILRMYVKE